MFRVSTGCLIAVALVTPSMEGLAAFHSQANTKARANYYCLTSDFFRSKLLKMSGHKLSCQDNCQMKNK